jgi:hypothetical protein
MAATTKRPAPRTLRTSGKKLWQDVTKEYDLRPDEYRILEDACRQADLVDELAKAQAAEALMIPGSMDQMILHPLIAEVRQHRTTLSNLLTKLKLPDLAVDDGDSGDGEGDDKPTPTGNDRAAKARAAANARWSRRGA